MQSTTTITQPRSKVRASTIGEVLGQKRRSQLLDALLRMTALSMLGLILISQANSLLQPNLATLLPELGGLLIVLICYGINRVGFTYAAAIIFFLALNVVITLYIARQNDDIIVIDLRSISTLLTVPVVAAGVILGPRYSFLFAGIGVASTYSIALARVKPGVRFFETPVDAISQLAVPISLMFAMAGMSWFFESNLRRLVGQLTAQNRSLDEANRELARKSEIEQQLSKRVDELTNRLSRAFEAQVRSTTEQISAVLRVSTTVEELNRISESISHASAQVDKTAQQAFQVVENGTATVRNGLTSLALLNEQTLAVAEAMDHLSQQARQIDQITELISEIAEETTLLSLNAKIEAAGAGEYGRRFASVAGEVQRLASRSRDASAQVRQVVEEIRRAVDNSMAVSRKGIQEAAGIMLGTRSMELTLEEIVRMVETTATLSRQISLSIQEQRGATVQVVETMRQISRLSSDVAQHGQVLMNNLHHLNEAVADLNAVGSS